MPPSGLKAPERQVLLTLGVRQAWEVQEGLVVREAPKRQGPSWAEATLDLKGSPILAMLAAAQTQKQRASA